MPGLRRHPLEPSGHMAEGRQLKAAFAGCLDGHPYGPTRPNRGPDEAGITANLSDFDSIGIMAKSGKLFKSPSKGVLSRFGYQVGARGPMRRERQNVLHRVFAYAGSLDIDGVDWAARGAGESAKRLQKMSNTLYSLKTNLEKKKDRTRNEAAITDYSHDLEFLKSTYYDGCFKFRWPDW